MTNPGGPGPGGFDLGSMFQQAQQQAEMMKQQMEASLKDKTVEGSTGGGMVTVTATGAGLIKKIVIDPQVVDPNDREMLEDLIVTAVNVALKKARELQDEAQQGQLGNMLGGGGGMPDLGALLGGGAGGLDLGSLLGGLGGPPGGPPPG